MSESERRPFRFDGSGDAYQKLLQRDELPIGTVLNERYVVSELLESGYIAAIYRGRQPPLDRPVDIKVLHLPSSRRAAHYYIERFLKEAKVISRIRHAGVVAVFDYGVIEDIQPYLVLEHLDGHSLEAEIDGGPIDVTRALGLVLSALDALRAAHDLGIVHRDLKPSCLFVSCAIGEPERLCVRDFGLAFVLDEQLQRTTQTGVIRGTPQYVAPEYLESQAVSPAIDVYQVGLILVEMLSGEPAIQGKSVYECFHRHAAGQLSIPDWLRDDDALGPIIARATAREPTTRYANAHALACALEKVRPSDVTVPEAVLAKTTHEEARTLNGIPGRPDPYNELGSDDEQA